jgi:MoxR-like ATPase
VRLEGNPGTGKTTIARLYAGMLKELDILKADTMQYAFPTFILSFCYT